MLLTDGVVLADIQMKQNGISFESDFFDEAEETVTVSIKRFSKVEEVEAYKVASVCYCVDQAEGRKSHVGDYSCDEDAIVQDFDLFISECLVIR